MANTVVTIIFQNSYATPLIRLSLRVIRSLVTTYLKFCIVTNWRMAYTKMALIFQICYATPIIRLLIRVLNTFDFLLFSFRCIFILWLSILFGGLHSPYEFFISTLGACIAVITWVMSNSNWIFSLQDKNTFVVKLLTKSQNSTFFL